MPSMFKNIKKKIKKIIKGDETNRRIKWSLYARVWREIGRPQLKWLILGVVATVLAAAAEAYTITLVQQVVDKAFIQKSMANIYFFGMQVIAAFGFKGIFSYAKSLLMAKAGLNASADLQQRIYSHMVKMNIAKFYGDGIGKHLNYFSVQAGAVLNLVTGTLVNTVQQIATLMMTLGLMVYYAPQLCAVLIFLVPAIMIPMVLIMRKRRKLSRESFGIANDVSQHLNQTLQGMKTIQAFANEETESKKFADVLNASMVNSYKGTQVFALQSPLLELMISIGLCLALIAGGHFIVTGAITTGDFTAFLLALTAAYKPARSITSTSNTVQHGLLAAEVLFDFLDSKPDIQDLPDAKDLNPGKLSVKFSHVSFSYVPDEPVLKDINLNVPAGKVCALVGPSGGGKTTMFNLIERFYEPQKGKIEINRTDIRKFTLQSLRENIAEVSQDVFLFNGTIEENIKYGAPNATHEQVEAAARAANAHDFIMNFPHKYQSTVGEGGALLSGGQKQRIAIARAILKDSPILLLDEATSALDTQSEKLIQAALKDLMRGRTTFVIAHRLSTILDADIICVIKDGHIVEQGTDAELVALGGEYKKLRDIQFKGKK
ncbi:MAG TPA: ABC transporter ATP-binding protein [Candidatus Enterousia avicola]|uniref:ABC transporter ATP-binding protein n=1 Tax=Candidatus Enterousia avicola TaxID=2840787 RepID=A0A9D1SLX4_9PROT|nr:ABC transporter ATP-binding protein [Candidatus Enterousia avicola]